MHYMPSILTLTAAICASGSVAFADPVEVKLSDRLDGNLDFYCFDISGAKEDANVAQGLQTHTCYGYQGESGIDQIFDSARIAQAQFYMPEFDVCATVSSYSAGTSVDLATCDGSDGQAIVMTDAGNISPVAAPDMCFTAGEDTRLGRGGTSEHQIKSLTLEFCDDDLAEYQTWDLRDAQY